MGALLVLHHGAKICKLVIAIGALILEIRLKVLGPALRKHIVDVLEYNIVEQ